MSFSKERARAISKAWYNANTERALARSKAWKQAHAAYMRAWWRNYRRKQRALERERNPRFCQAAQCGKRLEKGQRKFDRRCAKFYGTRKST